MATGVKTKKPCEICGKPIRKHGKVTRKCITCFNKTEKPNGEFKKCFCCGKENYYIRTRLNQKYFFCNRICQTKYRQSVDRTNKTRFECIVCGKEYYRYSYHRKYNSACCSIECSGKYRSEHYSGEKSKAYKNGMTSSRKIIKNSKRYFEWRTAILKYYGEKCFYCLREGVPLHVHHSKKFSTIFAEFATKYDLTGKTKKQIRKMAFDYHGFWDINNGVPLCVDCHANEHPERKLFVYKGAENADNHATR